MNSLPILLAAPGAGLGHLVRTCAISVELAKLGLQSRIVTHSTYAGSLHRATGCNIDFIPGSRWKKTVKRYADFVKPRIIVLDTFPWGIRNEWSDFASMDYRFVLLARRLNVPAYLEAAGLKWNADSPFPPHAIVCEPLGRFCRELFDATGSNLYELPGRVCLSPDNVSTGIPARLLEMLLKKPTWLVVHSGPRGEIEQLIEVAKTGMENRADGQIIVVLPREEDYPGVVSCRFFPAFLLYPYAHCIVTGAGYNCIAETGPWREKHLCRAFSRRYDEQEKRLGGAFRKPAQDSVNGAPFAARHIASLL